MEVQKDFEQLLELLNKHNVEYLIVAGYALGFHEGSDIQRYNKRYNIGKLFGGGNRYD